jgi:hypothetical protein
MFYPLDMKMLILILSGILAICSSPLEDLTQSIFELIDRSLL